MQKLLIFMFILMVACSLEATVIVKVEGTLNSVYENGKYSWDESVQVGTKFTAFIYYDDLVDRDPASDTGAYKSTGALVAIGNYVFNSNEGDLQIVTGENLEPGQTASDTGYWFSNSLTSSGIIYENGQPTSIDSVTWVYGQQMSLVFLTLNPDVVPTDEFPLNFPDLYNFDYANGFGIGFSGEEGKLRLDGTAESVNVIPEPCSVALVGFGGFLVLWRRRRVG